MAIVDLCRTILVRIGTVFGVGPTKPVWAISPKDYRRAYYACLNKSTDIGKLLKQANVQTLSITVTYRNAIGELKTMKLGAWQLARPGYYTDGDGSGILYRQKTTPKGNVIIQPLFMGMVNGGDEFDLIDDALEGTPAMYRVPNRSAAA